MNNFLHKLIILALGSILSCSPKIVDGLQNNSTANTQATNVQIIKPSPSDNGSKYVKEDGWEIPALALSEKKETSFWEVRASNGKKINVNVTDYDPLPADVITEEPFKSIGSSIKLVHIYFIREFSVGNQKFCYKVQVNRAGVDEKTGARDYSGSLFFFAYYDEDGDGKFESLIFDEKDEIGTSSMANAPHLPQWVMKR